MEGFDSPCFVDYDGIKIVPAFSPDAVRSAMNYVHKPGQLFLVSYPKCGSTWMQHIIILVLRKGEPIKDEIDFMLNAPFLEAGGAEAVDKITGPGVIKFHFPYNIIRFSPLAKYVYITRNPKDCCVSSYYHTKKMFFYNFQNGTFDKFFELFINGETDYGDYFDHLLSWYEHKDEPNIHFLTYEDLKKDTEGEILKLAKFMGEEYYDALTTDAKCMESILYYSSFEYMKKKFNEDIDILFKGSLDTMENFPLSAGFKYFFEFKSKYAPKEDTTDIKFVRKGIVGDWKNHFTVEQNKKFEEWVKRKTQGTDVTKLWEDSTI